ncbi:MAG: histidine kinase [Sulfuriflexus sp.]|nr:histidine kinase [Sulfuriflexus sp.]
MKPSGRQSPPQFTQQARLDGLFLPDLCSIRILLLVIIITELLAFVITLAASDAGKVWLDLGLISLFVQWVALSSVLLLCVSRPALARLDNTRAGVVSFIVINTVTLIVSEIAFSYIALPNMGAGTAAHIEFLLRNLGISVIVSLLTLRYFYLQYQSNKSMRAESVSRIEALQARIRPHFLFNSMNIIASLTRSDPKLAEQAVENLSQVFRASLSDTNTQITLNEEISICKSYLQIEMLRLGERLCVEWHIDSNAEQDMIPPLLLQPLIENAVIHGIEPLPDGGTIVINAQHINNDQILSLQVINPCDASNEHCTSSSKGNQLAHNNINARLDTLYEGVSHLKIVKEENKYIACIEIPVSLLYKELS